MRRALFAILVVIIPMMGFSGGGNLQAPPNTPTTQTDWGNWSQDKQRTAMDNICPRLEGIHLPGCCPPLLGSGLSCQYVVMVSRGQPTLVDSSYAICKDGVTQSVKCCAPSAADCYTDAVTLNFIQRLIARDNQCRFEPCPAADYWRSQPNPDARITPAHELFNGSAGLCSGSVQNQCSVAGSPICLGNNPCPPPPSPPGPGPGPGTGPTPDPGPPPPPTPPPGGGGGPAPVDGNST